MKKATLRRSATNWKRVRAMTDKDLDLSDSPELTPEMLERAVLRRGFKTVKPSRKNLADAIRSYFAPFGGVDLPIQKREPTRRPPKLTK